jgi:hypothetical protein
MSWWLERVLERAADRREKRKAEFIRRMEDYAEEHYRMQCGRSAAWQIYGANMRRLVAQKEAGIMKVELIKAEYVAMLERQLAITTTENEQLRDSLARCRAEMELLRQQASSEANDVGSLERARISGRPLSKVDERL